ncbi:MAG: NifB/NifX family molybdenum-iron cluster-binding protein [Oscillospiraceae bacterium]|nr:NifB/NifX family molybdenum-iron cluster-binding protein [Oscillospiraceae bacterium]
MKIAVAYEDGQIYEHFGHSKAFAIYEYEGMDIESCKKTVIDCSDKHGHTDMANLMRDNDVNAVISGTMGSEARALLLEYAIVPVTGYCGDADDAAALLLLGQLPIMDDMGICSGGCGGCGGGCGGCGGCGGGCGCGCDDEDF